MCHLLWWIGQGGNFYSLFGQTNTNLVEDIKILLPVKVSLNSVQRFQKKSQNMSQPIRGQGGHIVFWISPKNTNLVEDVENLLSVKFRWIPFSGFIAEVENVSSNQRTGRLSSFSDQPEKRKPGRGCWGSCFLSSFVEFYSAVSEEKLKMSQQIIWPGRPFCFSDPPEKHRLGIGRWDLASYQVSSNSFQRFKRKGRKCLCQSEARAANLFFPIGLKNTNVVEGIEILLPVKFRWIQFSGFFREVENVSANQRPGRPFCFSDRPEKHKLGRGLWDLASYQVSLNSVQRFLQRSRKCLSPSEAGAAILFFWSARKTQTW